MIGGAVLSHEPLIEEIDEFGDEMGGLEDMETEAGAEPVEGAEEIEEAEEGFEKIDDDDDEEDEEADDSDEGYF